MVMGGNNNIVLILKSKTQNEQISRDRHYLYFGINAVVFEKTNNNTDNFRTFVVSHIINKLGGTGNV